MAPKAAKPAPRRKAKPNTTGSDAPVPAASAASPASPAGLTRPLAPGQPSPSGMLKAGEILLLVGAILHAVGAVLTIGAGLFFISYFSRFSDGPVYLGVVYLVLGVLLAIGTLFAIRAWKDAQAGRLRGAWINGLVSSLLPPLQVVTLLGAIFVLVSPESEAQKAVAVAQAAAQAP